jgi:hypothetical protein
MRLAEADSVVADPGGGDEGPGPRSSVMLWVLGARREGSARDALQPQLTHQPADPAATNADPHGVQFHVAARCAMSRVRGAAVGGDPRRQRDIRRPMIRHTSAAPGAVAALVSVHRAVAGATTVVAHVSSDRRGRPAESVRSRAPTRPASSPSEISSHSARDSRNFERSRSRGCASPTPLSGRCILLVVQRTASAVCSKDSPAAMRRGISRRSCRVNLRLWPRLTATKEVSGSRVGHRVLQRLLET